MLSTGAVFFYYYNRIKVLSGKENCKGKKKAPLDWYWLHLSFS